MSIRIKIAKNGHATLSGVPYDDLRSILTAASLYRYDHPHVPQSTDGSDWPDIIERNNASDEAWHKRQRQLLDYLHDVMLGAIQATWPKPGPRTIEARKAKAKADKERRLRLRELLRQHIVCTHHSTPLPSP